MTSTPTDLYQTCRSFLSSWNVLLPAALCDTAKSITCFQPNSRRTVVSTQLRQPFVVYNDIVRAVDSGQLVPLVLLDLSSAFDIVDHDCLLTILGNRFTVEGRAMDWFQSYLTERLID